MNKIDYFGGLHGNYLELVTNVFIFQNQYDVRQDIFGQNGACHIKNLDIEYEKFIYAEHWSHWGLPFSPKDLVVRIVPKQTDLLIAVTNLFLRAGDQMIDLENLDQDTRAKLSTLAKAKELLTTLEQQHGQRNAWDRSILRNFFYSMLNDPENGIDMMNKFDPVAEKVYNFPLRAFFEVDEFYNELNGVARFFNQNFYPTADLYLLHRQFLDRNQGFASEQKCKQVWNDILAGHDQPLSLNILEEAWINWQIARSFRAYELPELCANQYPTSTNMVSKIIFDWKKQDY
jgi:hypothetical protein